METNDVIVPPGLEVTAANSNEDVIRVPVETEHSGAQWLLNVLAHPPVGRESVLKNCFVSHTHFQHHNLIGKSVYCTEARLVIILKQVMAYGIVV